MVQAPECVPWYEAMDAAMLRASVHASDVIPRSWPDVHAGADAERWCGWLAEVWAEQPVAEAVAVASPVLADRIEALCAGARPVARQARHALMAVARYLVRMRGRATPFGTFAGVTALRFGPHASLRWTGGHRVRLRADAVWLADLIGRLESCPGVRHRLPVVVNDLVLVRGERLVVPWQPPAAGPDCNSPVEVSIRNVPAVQTIIEEVARTPIRAGDLIDKLAAEYPGAARSALDAMVAELVARGVLVTSLRPPSTCTEGLAYVLARLRDEAAPEAQPLLSELRAIHAQIDALDHRPDAVDGPARQGLAARMRELSTTTEQPLMVDLLLGCQAVLPVQLAAEAASAAQALMRLTPLPAGEPAWREYHGSFLDQYGPGAMVPIAQLVDATAGLGFPRHFTEPGQPSAAGALSPRDERLLALAQQAALDGARQVVLDDDALDALAAHGSEQPPATPHVDVLVEVHAPTITALDQGAFALAVCGIGRTAATTGRFLDLLPADDRQRMTGLYGQLRTRVDGALAAQMSSPPQHPRVENTVRVPRVLPEVISLAEHPDGLPGHIPVQDLAITADRDRLYVVSLSRRRVVEPIVPHAGSRHTLPAVARLLFEIPRAAGPAVSPFDWGAATCLPFRPRVRYGRSILAPAQWRLHAADLPNPAARTSDWTAAFAAVRDRHGLPAWVSVGTGDRRLRLNLDDSLDQTLLRAHLDAASTAVPVSEAPTATDLGWFGGRAHEIVIPLAATAPPVRAPAVISSSAALPVLDAEQGSGVLFAKLFGHPDVFDTILTHHLESLLAMWDEPPLWWFVRYRRPAPHLRLRLPVQDYERAAGHVGAWAADLRRCGLIGELTLDTYRPEIGRYGTGPAMAAAETLFAADSAAAVAQLAALAQSPHVRPQALTAASLADLVCAMTGSRTAGTRWLLDHPELATTATIRDRDLFRQTLRLADAATLDDIPGGPAITAAWHTRAQAAAGYADSLAARMAHVTPASVLPSLLHLHHDRAHGIDPDAEAAVHRLARAVALSRNARQPTTDGGTR